VVGQAGEPFEGIHRLEIAAESGIHLGAVHDSRLAVEVSRAFQRPFMTTTALLSMEREQGRLSRPVKL
jgi:hypothetical protein